MPGSTPFHVPPNVLHGCDSTLVGRQHRSTPGTLDTDRVCHPTTSYRGRGTRGRRGTRTVRPGIQGQGPTAGDRQGARAEGQRPDEEVRHHRSDPGDDGRPRAAPARRRAATHRDGQRVDRQRRRAAAPWSSRRSHPLRPSSEAPATLDLEAPARAAAVPTDAEEPPAEWELAVAGDDVDDVTAARQRRPRQHAGRGCRHPHQPGSVRADQRSRPRAQRRRGPAAGRRPAGAARLGPAGRGRREPQPAAPSAPQGRCPRPRRPAGRRRPARSRRRGRAGRPDAGAGRRVGLPRHARRGVRLPAREGLPAEPRRRLHPGQAGPPVRPAQGRPRHRAEPAGRPQREEPGAARGPHRQRRRPRGRPPPSPVRGPHGAVPRREAAPRGPRRPDQHDGADHRPRGPDRQGPARHHRVAAEGRQDVRDEDDRHVDRGATTPRSS